MMPPLKILAQQHHKTGVRRQKRETIVWEKPRVVEPVVVRRIQPWVNHMGQAIDFGQKRRTQVKAAKNSLGNLLWTDYRFFIGGKEPASQYSRCRACREILIGHAERQAHLEKYKCTLWLTESYRVLNLLPNALLKMSQIVKRECVSCGQVTTHTLWGIPMCQKLDTCVDSWMFDEEMPCANLTAALVEVGKILGNSTLKEARRQYEKNTRK